VVIILVRNSYPEDHANSDEQSRAFRFSSVFALEFPSAGILT